MASGEPFDLQVALHGGMGPGGVLMRATDHAPWSSLDGASASGAEALPNLPTWTVGHGDGGADDRRFLGRDLRVWTAHAAQPEV